MNLVHHLGRFSWAVAARTLPLVNGFLLILFVIPALPVAEFGKYSIIFAIAMQIIFVNKSLVLNPMIKFAAEPGRLETMARTGFWLNGILYLCAGLIIWSLSPLLSKILQVQTRDILLAIAFLPLFFIRDWSFCVQQTLYRMRRLFLLDAVYFLGSSAGYIYLWHTNRITQAADILYINFLAALVSSLVALITGSGVKTIFMSVKWRDIKQILQYGYWTLKIGLFSSLLSGADSLILGAIYNPAIVGVYSGAKKVYQVVSAFTAAIGVLVMPYASRLASDGRVPEVRALYEKAVGYTTVGLVSFALFMGLAADYFFAIFMGQNYQGSAPLLRLMMLGAPFEGLFVTAGTLLYGIGAANAAAVVSGYGLLILCILLPLGAYFGAGFGAAGAVGLTLAIAGIWMFRRASTIIDSSLGAIAARISIAVKTLLAVRNR